jgi:hypothetical protein
MKKEPNAMRIKLSTDDDMRAVDFLRGTICAVCGKPIDGPPALWLAVESLDFFVHKDCEVGFTSEIVKRHIGDIVLVMQDKSLHDMPPDRN